MSEHKRIWSLFGARLHWGEPHFPTRVRAYTGAVKSKTGDGPWSLQFTDHEIVRWYGLSFRLAGFFGWQRFGATSWPHEVGALPYEKAKP